MNRTIIYIVLLFLSFVHALVVLLYAWFLGLLHHSISFVLVHMCLQFYQLLLISFWNSTQWLVCSIFLVVFPRYHKIPRKSYTQWLVFSCVSKIPYPVSNRKCSIIVVITAYVTVMSVTQVWMTNAFKIFLNKSWRAVRYFKAYKPSNAIVLKQ